MQRIRKGISIRILVLTMIVFAACANGQGAFSEEGTTMSSDAWANTLFESAIHNMDEVAENEFRHANYLFSANSGNGTTGYSVSFTEADDAVGYAADGKTILAVYHANKEESLSVYEQDGMVNPKEPYYLPTYTNGDPIYANIPPERFANHVNDCEYLIVFGGFESGRNVGYYSGGVDRVIITTLVLVIDVQSEKVLHIQNIGTDSPGMTTSNPTGRALYDEAGQYLTVLLAPHSS